MFIDRSTCPQPKHNIDFNLPSIKHLIFDNKLPIFFIPKSDLPIVQLGLIINAGSKYDERGKSGTAKLTSMVVDEGAGNFTSLELDNEFETLGTIFNIDADKDSTIITMLSLSENFEKSLELLSQILKFPHFNAADFFREREKLKTQLLQLKDQPGYLARTAFEKIVFKNSPYSNPINGDMLNIENINVSDVKTFHKNFFGVNNAELIIVGNINESTLLSYVDKYFSDWINVASSENNFIKPKEIEKNIYIIDRKEAPQTEIYIGHISGKRKSKDFYAKLLMNSILGGQFTSRINLNLREDKGYTYGAHSSFSYYKEFGKFFVSTSVKAEHTGDSIKEILDEIEKIKLEVTSNEVEFSKSFLIKRFPAQFETYSQLVHNLALLSIHSLPLNYFNNYVKNMNSLSADDVLSAARKYLHPEKMTIVLVGDKDKISKQIDLPFTVVQS